MACPGCGADTPSYTLVYGSGASAEYESKPSWCNRCLADKVAATRVGRSCHCSQFPDIHVHEKKS